MGSGGVGSASGARAWCFVIATAAALERPGSDVQTSSRAAKRIAAVTSTEARICNRPPVFSSPRLLFGIAR